MTLEKEKSIVSTNALNEQIKELEKDQQNMKLHLEAVIESATKKKTLRKSGDDQSRDDDASESKRRSGSLWTKIIQKLPSPRNKDSQNEMTSPPRRATMPPQPLSSISTGGRQDRPVNIERDDSSMGL